MNVPRLSALQAAKLRAELSGCKNRNTYRRAAALLAAHQGLPVSRIAEFLGVTRQSIYNWITTYGTEQDTIDLQDAPRSGRPPVWSAELDAFVQSALNRSPQSFGYADEQWTTKNLRNHLVFSLQKTVSGETLRRRLRDLGYVWRNRRYVHNGKANGQEKAAFESLIPC